MDLAASPMRESQSHSKKTVLVLCGGGSKGAMEVGLYRALSELGVPIDLIVGTSIGAVNGAFIAAGEPPERLADLWRRVRRRDIFQFNRQLLWRLLGADSLYSNEGLRHFLLRHLPVHRFEELKIPLIITATKLQTGEALAWDSGDLIEAILGSVALPGIFPPAQQDGYQVVDGGISDNVPLEVAIAQGAEVVIFMLCVCCDRLTTPMRGMAKIISQAVGLLVDQKYQRDFYRYQELAQLIALQPSLGLDIGLLDFSHTEELLEGSYQFAIEELRKNHGILREAS